ncbi:hypothetical protein VNI00_007847 [Paramarasmius palmivorus]|uniref:Transketolase-like pyrimidine-binding domain-containing protein n=1 Tax=Paramarasmius palmivorus TaxID=297713 RepID=A0AAW0CXP6_9AGAR
MADTELVVSTIRCLAADLVQQYKGGHAGTVMGAAPVGVSLWRDVMRYNPKDPLWFNRDRFVLSAGHACLFQYIMLHLTGYPIWTLDELKRYHSRDFQTSRAAGHPEIEQEVGIEVTTGPLGQGIANSVGLAIAAKQLAAQYNKPGFEGLIDNTIWCFTGDGCIQEGVGQEAISMAGHLGLDNLVLIYDANKITVDGTIAACFTEDVPLRFKAANWNVITLDQMAIPTAEAQVSAITDALLRARQYKGQPTIVVIDTIIGYGSRKANTGPAHGQALGDEEVAYVKKQFGMSPSEKFVIPQTVYDHFSGIPAKGVAAQKEWDGLIARYAQAYPAEHAELQRRLSGRLPDGWRDLLPKKDGLPTTPQPTRKSSGIVVETLAPKFRDIVAGSADLLESTFVSWKAMVEFQKPDSGRGDFSGRQIRYGIREFSMAAIANGLAAYFPQVPGSDGGGILPVYSTFFMFTSYALPAIRMAALQHLRTIAVATHDSIGIGEDGPTHQPIALASFFRALPNCRLWRPADAEETIAAWIDAISWTEVPSHPVQPADNGDGGHGVSIGRSQGHSAGKGGPTLLCLSRQPVPLLEGSSREKVWRGAYTIWESTSSPKPNLVLVATGAEVALAVKVASELSSSFHVRVVSAPCLSVFDSQSTSYRKETIPSTQSLVVAIEAWSSFGWARYAHASVSMQGFGHSGPQADLFEFFGFGVKNVTKVIREWVGRHSDGQGNIVIPGVGEFEELLKGFVPGSA